MQIMLRGGLGQVQLAQSSPVAALYNAWTADVVDESRGTDPAMPGMQTGNYVCRGACPSYADALSGVKIGTVGGLLLGAAFGAGVMYLLRR